MPFISDMLSRFQLIAVFITDYAFAAINGAFTPLPSLQRIAAIFIVITCFIRCCRFDAMSFLLADCRH